MAKSHFRVILTTQIHSVWLVHKASAYSDSVWRLLVCHLENYTRHVFFEYTTYTKHELLQLKVQYKPSLI